MTILISAPTLNEVYVKLISTILNDGMEIQDERGDNIKEILNVVTNITEPFGVNSFNIIEPMQIIDGFPMNHEQFQIYCRQFLNPDKSDFVYTYGERLRHYEVKTGHILGQSSIFVDQIDKIIDKLNENNYTRRATAVTWMPYKDNINEDVPCLVHLDFKIRNDKLYESITYRSHDALLGYYPNLIGLIHVAQYVLKQLHGDIEMGEITVHSISAHIRETDFDLAYNIVNHNQDLL